MSEPSTSSKVSKTEDDSSVRSSGTDMKRGAFGKGRALSSKQLGAKRISTTAAPAATEDREKMKKALLEQPEKKKSKHKEAAPVAEPVETPISEPQPERVTIQPLDEATQNALKKRSKRRGSDSSGDPNKAHKSKSRSKEPEIEETPVAAPSTKRRDSQEDSSDSEAPKGKKKHRRSQSPSKQIPQLAVPVSVLPPILSDRSNPEDDGKPLSTPPSFPPPLTPNGSSTSARTDSPGRTPSQPLLSQASPRPFAVAPLSARSSGGDSPNASPGTVRPLPPGVQRDVTPPPPMPESSEELPPPPPSDDDSDDDAVTPAASTDSLGATAEIPVRTFNPSDSQSSLPLAQITVSNSTSSIGADSEDEDSNREHKKEKRKKNRAESVELDSETVSKHTRERSGTKGRRDSDTVAPLALGSIAPPSPTSTPLSSSRGLMRLNRTPRGENVSSPRGQILIINPAGDTSATADVAPPPPHTTILPVAFPVLLSDSNHSLNSLSNSSVSRRDSVDLGSDDGVVSKSSLHSSMSGSMSEMPPPPPPMPTIGVPPPPPMPSRGAAAVAVAARRDSDAQYEEIAVARTRVRRVVPTVEAAVKLWDSRATNFEQRMVSEVAHKTAPEELLEFPADDLLLEIVNSQLQHYPPLDGSAPPSVKDCYSSYTSQLKIICRQSLWYGTETSPKDRFKEYETRMSRAKVEAQQAAQAAAAQQAAHPAAEIRNKSNANARRPSISRGAGSETSITRRASRAIKMTNSSSVADDTIASALPDLNEDEDSSAQESNEGEESASETTPVPTVEVRDSQSISLFSPFSPFLPLPRPFLLSLPSCEPLSLTLFIFIFDLAIPAPLQ